METRITREMEKNKSVLYKAREQAIPSFGGFDHTESTSTKFTGSNSTHMDLQQEQEFENELSQEQLQLLEKENVDMMKHYEDTLNQVRYINSLILPMIYLTVTELPRNHLLRSRNFKHSLSIT